MPKLTPGAATQAAARKVADSDNIAENKANYDPKQDADAIAADEAQQQAGPPAAAKKPAPARKPAAKSPAPAAKPAEESGQEKTSPLDESEDYTVLVMYGPAGTRKTTSALRLTKSEETGLVLVIAAEAGMKPQALRGHGIDTSRVRYWPERGKPVTYEGLERLFFQILADLEKDPASWAGVVWDSLTEVIQTMVDNAAAAEVARLKEIARVAKKDIQIRPVYERDGSDYQVVTGQFRTLLRKWRTLPCHQIFVALEESRDQSVETDDGRKVKVPVIGPSLPPKVREDVEQHADVIMRVSVVDVPSVGAVGVGRATASEDLRAKDRYNILPVVMLDPGFERVWDYITGKLTEADDLAQKVEGVSAAVESPGEKTTRQAAERKAATAARRTAAPKGTAQRPNAKVTADSGTESNPPI